MLICVFYYFGIDFVYLRTPCVSPKMATFSSRFFGLIKGFIPRKCLFSHKVLPCVGLYPVYGSICRVFVLRCQSASHLTYSVLFHRDIVYTVIQICTFIHTFIFKVDQLFISYMLAH